MLKLNEFALAAIVLLPQIGTANEASPYVGQEHRDIKSLSQQDIEALSRGDGMGFAKAAELNGFPGPRHVLELAEALQLTADQYARTEALYEEMRRNAGAAGAQLIAAEAELDTLFAGRNVDVSSLQKALDSIAEVRARLRYVHLEAHLRQQQILSARQVARYAKLRRYQSGHGHSH
ncbi:MAG: hypothetical protein OEO82_07860 [Gammaproteobacteria bacterium]|nr:hypothetical protein [Gammaproteobacteria bacterium]